jgi:hypothetical protein
MFVTIVEGVVDPGPGALAMFEQAGAEPSPSFWSVEGHAERS